MSYPPFDPDRTAHEDNFIKRGAPALSAWPELVGQLDYPERLNAAEALLRGAEEAGHGSRTALIGSDERWTYDELTRRVDAIAHALTTELGLRPGGRVLLRAPNTPQAAAAWLAVLKAGGVAVATMPLLRAKELVQVIERAKVSLCLCTADLMEEMQRASERTGARVVSFGAEDAELDQLAAKHQAPFEAVQTYQDDPAILAFTSGTTGNPKACVHFHRDILAMADGFSQQILGPSPEDIFCGTPPLAFTFGLGALLIFPLRAGAAAILPGQVPMAALMEMAEAEGATVLCAAPTAYRAMLGGGDIPIPASLRLCVSAGEALPEDTSERWLERTGIRIVDGIGSTEMIHIFISAPPHDCRPGATGKPLLGYEADIVGPDFESLDAGEVGRLVVKGPVGCRYFDDERQADYVVNGWNVTGDLYRRDEDGFYHYVSRADDMIVTSGYNVAAVEVEAAVLTHEDVRECVVVAAPDKERGSVICAFVVARVGAETGEALAENIKAHVRNAIAPYKYPRRIAFVRELPRTATGKVQRYTLRQQAAAERLSDAS